jgi:hypothetical protein
MLGMSMSRAVVVLCLCVALSPSSARAEITEGKIKAVFLYNFLNYITWPEPIASTRNTICLFVSEDKIFNTLKLIQKRDSSFDVEKRHDDDYEGCHVSYEPFSGERASSKNESALKHNVLRVSSEVDFISKGRGNVEFFSYKRGVKIRIDASHLNRTGLKASSKLLSIAEVVNR